MSFERECEDWEERLRRLREGPGDEAAALQKELDALLSGFDAQAAAAAASIADTLKRHGAAPPPPPAAPTPPRSPESVDLEAMLSGLDAEGERARSDMARILRENGLDPEEVWKRVAAARAETPKTAAPEEVSGIVDDLSKRGAEALDALRKALEGHGLTPEKLAEGAKRHAERRPPF